MSGKALKRDPKQSAVARKLAIDLLTRFVASVPLSGRSKPMSGSTYRTTSFSTVLV